jgi:hypothetical protein
MVEWLGDEDFDPDYFDRTEVQFDDPKERLNYVLDNEEGLSEIMLEHEDEFYNQFEFSDLAADHEYEPETEVNPFLHIFIHSIVETQLEEKNPIEVVQFYKAMQRKGSSRHDTIHLIGVILAPVMFSVLKDKSSFDLDTYRALLRKYKSKDPEEIMDLLVSEDQ